MINFALIAICMIAGVMIRRWVTLPKDAHKGINTWIIYIALPAVSFKYLPNIQWSSELLFPVMAPVVVFIAGWIYFRFASRSLQLNKPDIGGLTLIASLGNTSFLGFPLVTAYFGESELGTAVICDQVTFLLLSTVGVIVALNASDKHRLTASTIIKKVVLFPPLIGCVAALTIPHYWDITDLTPLFDKLSGTVAPLALFSIGLQLQFEGWQYELKAITITLIYKLLLAPAIVLGAAMLLHMNGNIVKISVFEMAMPSLISAAVVANEYELNPKLINLVLGVGIVLSFLTTAIWYQVLLYVM